MTGEDDGGQWLSDHVAVSRSAVDGAMCLADGIPLDPESLSWSIGAALAELHAVPVTGAPFEPMTTAALMERAKTRAENELAATDDGPYRGVAPHRLVEILEDQVGRLDGPLLDPVLVHGALSSSAIWYHPDTGVTLTEWTNVGVGDRHFDLAMGVKVLGETYGYAVAGPFFDTYGLDTVDALRLDTHQLLVHVLTA